MSKFTRWLDAWYWRNIEGAELDACIGRHPAGKKMPADPPSEPAETMKSDLGTERRGEASDAARAQIERGLTYIDKYYTKPLLADHAQAMALQRHVEIERLMADKDGAIRLLRKLLESARGQIEQDMALIERRTNVAVRLEGMLEDAEGTIELLRDDLDEVQSRIERLFNSPPRIVGRWAAQ